MTTTDVSSLINGLYSVLTGRTAAGSTTDTFTEIIHMANAPSGMNTVFDGISMIWNKTYFAERPYKGIQIDGITKSSEEYGNAKRVIYFADKFAAEPDPSLSATATADGQSIDHYRINKSKPLQFFIERSENFMVPMSVFRDALKKSLRSPEELANFMASEYTNYANSIEQRREAYRLACLDNMILAKCGYNHTVTSDVRDVKYSTSTQHKIKLLSEFNAFTGQSYTATTVMAQAYEQYAHFCVARIAEIAEMMACRTTEFHQQVDGSTGAPIISTHTPAEKRHALIVAKYGLLYDNLVKQNAHNPDAASRIKVQRIPFLQSPTSPDTVTGKYSILKHDGTEYKVTTAETTPSVIAVLYDEDAMGIVLRDDSTLTTPVNAAGKYYNIFAHIDVSWYNNMIANAVVFVNE